MRDDGRRCESPPVFSFGGSGFSRQLFVDVIEPPEARG